MRSTTPTTTPTTTTTMQCDWCGHTKDNVNAILPDDEAKFQIRVNHGFDVWYFCVDCSMHLEGVIEHERELAEEEDQRREDAKEQ